MKHLLNSKLKYILLLDYDGTLTPIVTKPNLAKLSSSRRNFLKKLSLCKNIIICIVSGRSLQDVRNKVKLNGIYYIGNHGFEMEGPTGKTIMPKVKQFLPLMSSLFKRLKQAVKVKGVIIENKKYTLSIHYRLATLTGSQTIKTVTKKILKPYLTAKKIKVTYGKKVIEIRPPLNWHKGKAVRWILGELKIKDALPIYIGDDKTDEDAFGALPKKGITIRVGKVQKSAAQLFFKDINEVYKFLRFIKIVIESSLNCC